MHSTILDDVDTIFGFDRDHLLSDVIYGTGNILSFTHFH
jgi:hypothetical protein